MTANRAAAAASAVAGVRPRPMRLVALLDPHRPGEEAGHLPPGGKRLRTFRGPAVHGDRAQPRLAVELPAEALPGPARSLVVALPGREPVLARVVHGPVAPRPPRHPAPHNPFRPERPRPPTAG